MEKPRVKVPKTVTRGEPFEVKALISHKMESGLRVDKDSGATIARKIITGFSCKLDGTEVFRAELHPGVSANPYLAFYVRAENSGELEFTWHEDGGGTTSTRKSFSVK